VTYTIRGLGFPKQDKVFSLYRSFFAALCASALFTAPASAQTANAEDLAARFGARMTLLDISLSPSGNKVAYISSDNASTEILYVVDLAGTAEPVPVTRLSDANSDLDNCSWASDDWLVCETSGYSQVEGGIPVGFSRMFAVSADGEQINTLTTRGSSYARGYLQDGGTVLALDVEGKDNTILMTRQFLDETRIGSRLGNAVNGLGVETVDLVRASRRSTVERPDDDATRYVADENGEVRLKVRRPDNATGRLTGETYYFYRSAGSKRWRPFEGELSEFRPVSVDAASGFAYGYKRRDGYWAVYRAALDGSGNSELVAARDDVDVDRLIRIGRKQRIVGVSYATEKREVEYFDPELASLARALRTALPGQPLIDIVDASADEQVLLIVASSDTDPGMSYLLDRSNNSLSPLLPLREHLAQVPMANMEPVMFPAADGTQIPGYLTRPSNTDGPKRAVVLPHGGPGARDYWGFDWIVQFLAARGYAVLQPNFRGSSGYGAAWFGRNGFQAWELAVGDVNDAGRWLISEGIADSDQLAIMGWSYGGYAALQSQVLDPDLYQAVVAIAAVTDLKMLVEEARDYSDYSVVRRFVGQGPHVRAGSPTNFAEQFKAPVLLFHGTQDLNVAHTQSRRMKNRLEDAGRAVEYVEYDGFDHYLDHGQLRGNMLLKIDGFLNDALKR